MIPPLYKFRDINDYTLDSLRKGYLYFANMTTLNDPFEMGAYLEQVSDIEVARMNFMTRDWTGSAFEGDLANLAHKEREAFLSDFWNSKDYRNQFLERLKSKNSFDEALKKNMSIYCASATRTDRLLWAHYGYGHRGIAIELNFNADQLMSQARKVHYQKELPIIDVLQDEMEANFRKGVLTKSIDWKYEQEYRVVHPNACENARHHLAPSAFVSISFGAKIKDEDRKKVIKATRSKLSHIRFYQAYLGKKSFSVNFEEYRAES